MMPFKPKYEHLSGAQKRKLKAQQKQSQAKLKKINTFFTPSSSSLPSTSTDQQYPDQQDSGKIDSGEKDDSDNCGESSIREDSLERDEAEDVDVATDIVSKHKTNVTNPIVQNVNYVEAKKMTHEILLNVVNEYPTDCENFPMVLDDETKRFIIRNGPCKPRGPFPKDSKQNNRSFSEKYYFKTTKTGLKISREWLCYSPKKDSVYCEACWLFSERKNLQSTTWIDGVRDWQGLSKKIEKHESSYSHLNACVVLNLWRKKQTIDVDMESNLKNETNKWIKVLDRIVNVTLTLAASNLAFRGHRENISQPNSGNFLAIIDLLSKYDPVLQEIVTGPKHSNKYMSPKIQNELIQLLSNKVENSILKEIKSAQFFSIIMDTTQDITKKDQLSQIIRYVSISEDEAGRPISLKIKESFLGFKELTDQTGEGLAEDILKSIEDKGLKLSKCRGQGYDGAANMSGVYKGVKSRIENKQKTAKYVHCAAHNLNLVLNDAISNIQENRNFFDIVEQLYVFFSQSIKRWEILSTTTYTLKKLCPTRWSSRIDSLKALRHNYVEIMKAFTKIILNSSKSNEKTQAISLKKHLESFEFVFQVVLHTLILESTNLVSKKLQREDTDLQKATKLLNDSKSELLNIRNNYDAAVVTATAIAQQWGVDIKFKDRRRRKVKKHVDELAEDERLSDPDLYFKIFVFNGTLDTVINQITSRFEGMQNVISTFYLLTPEFLSTSTDEQLNLKSTELAAAYNEDFTSDFPHQMLSFRRALKPEIVTKKSVKEICELLLIEHYSVACSVPDVCTAYILFLTLPVTVATAERSFSKLKLIKNYLRSTMSQERLSGLSILSIESEVARVIDLKEVIKAFASQNSVRTRKFK